MILKMSIFLSNLLLCYADLYSLDWCNYKYCIGKSSTTDLSIGIKPTYAINSPDTGLVFPDSKFFELLHTHNFHENQITKLEFGQYCNIVFDRQLLNFNPLPNLKSINFDKICWLNSIRHGYCLDVPDEWRQKNVQLMNNRFCINSVNEMTPNLIDEVTFLYDELDSSKGHVEMLNNSLARALNLYTETEKANKQLQIQLNSIERDNQICETNLNRTFNIAQHKQRQLFKCSSRLERVQQIKVEKFKDLLDELYGHFIGQIYNS